MSLETRTPGLENRNTTGIYLGTVVNHLDTTFMGGLEVEILKRTRGGNLKETVQCKYASPFFGQTPYSGLSRNSGYANTQKSYGFWAVPPDVGTQVIVIMPEGDYANAYWIACVPDTNMNFMTPGYAGTTFNDRNRQAALPVGEYNKLAQDPGDQDPHKLTRPASPTRVERLQQAGLELDWVRGTNTSSARREAPSMVFGISTPGPPDKAGPTHRYGPADGQINAPYNRLGGSSFVMDDGDMSMHRRTKATEGPPDYAMTESGDRSGKQDIPANELIRIQTRTGHQILLHNSEDLVYISHGSGNSWIEMTANGKIDIYSKDSVSIRSENDLNFTADRDINFTAAKNINMIAEQNARLTVLENLDIRSKNQKTYVEEDCHHQVGQTYFQEQRNLQVHVEESGKITLLQDLDLVTENDLKIKQRTFSSVSQLETSIATTSGKLNLKASTNIRSSAGQTFEVDTREIRLTGQNVDVTSNGRVYLVGQDIGLGAVNVRSSTPITQGNVSGNRTAEPADDPQIAVESERSEEAEKAFYTKRVPAHEPWPDHEHINPTTFTPEQTIADQEERPEQQEAPPFPFIQDTFNR